jgi:hypothetical protein
MRTTLHNVAAISAVIMTISFQLTETIRFPNTPDYIQILCLFLYLSNQLRGRLDNSADLTFYL